MSGYVLKSFSSVVEEKFTDGAVGGRPARLDTGFPRLNELLGGGIAPGLMVLGASPGLGKSTFALQLAENVARAEDGPAVLFFSLEMPDERVVAKAISRSGFMAARSAGEITAQTGRGEAAAVLATADELLSGGLVGEKRRRMEQAKAEVARGSELYVIDEAMSARQIAAFAAEFCREQRALGKTRPPMVIVDYLQILPVDPSVRGFVSDRQRVESDLAQMVALSRENRIPVLLISSLNRGSYSDPMKMESFKETGGIEYSADVLMGLQFSACHGGKQKNFSITEEKSAYPRQMELVILKQRYGVGSGQIPLRYYAEYDYFEEAPQPAEEKPQTQPVPGPEVPAAPAKPEPQKPERNRKAVELSYLNNTKIAYEIRKSRQAPGEWAECRVSGSGEAEVVTRYQLSAELSCFDCDVADAVYTLYNNGLDSFTPGQVLRALTGDGGQTLTAQKRDALIHSLDKLIAARITIDRTQEAEKMENKRAALKAGEKLLSGSFLQAKKDGDGQKTRYHFTGAAGVVPMPLYEYAQWTRQMIAVPRQLLAVVDEAGRKISDTAENITIKRFLIRRLEVIRKGRNSAFMRSVRYAPRTHGPDTGLLAQIGVIRATDQSDGSWRNKCRNIHSVVVKMLEHYQRIGYISGFQTVDSEGVDIVGPVSDPKKIKYPD